MHIKTIDLPGISAVTESLKRRPLQIRAAVTLIKKAQFRLDRQAIGRDSLLERGHLARDRLPFRLLLGGDASIHGGAKNGARSLHTHDRPPSASANPSIVKESWATPPAAELVSHTDARPCR